jgi:hypothetical protein
MNETFGKVSSFLTTRIVYFICCLIFSGIANAAANTDFKGQLSLNYLANDSSPSSFQQTNLRYIPDLTYQYTLPTGNLWDVNVSANAYANHLDHTQSETTSCVELYRFNTQYKTSQSDTRLGLQKINFGPALILRSLRWFDQVNPTDPLQLTDGVKALRYRYFYPNNANVWLWALYGNDEPKGYELLATKEDSLEFGGRLQYPLETGELGMVLHHRQVEAVDTLGTPVGEDLNEYRYALDGRWDLEMGLWFEYVMIEQGAGTDYAKGSTMLTLGADYTLGMGNGVHVLVEHMSVRLSDSNLGSDLQDQTSVLQLSYPLGLLDSISLMSINSWSQDFSLHYLRWDRVYDDWIISLGLFSSPEQATSNILGLTGKGIQATVVFNH